MATAAYRPNDRHPGVTQALNDAAWLPFVGFGAPAIFQCVAIAVGIFHDRRPRPVFPRWVAYFNVWVALLLVPGLLVICFHDGPFAWDGVFAFWIPLGVFSLWYFVMAVPLLAAIKDEEAGTRGPSLHR